MKTVTPHLTEEEARTFVKALDLSPIAWQLHLPESENGLNWSVKKIKQVEGEYRGYLFVSWKYPYEYNVPSKDMDLFWHNHILFTAKYRRDCDALFGYYLQHNPEFGMPKPTEEFLKEYNS